MGLWRNLAHIAIPDGVLVSQSLSPRPQGVGRGQRDLDALILNCSGTNPWITTALYTADYPIQSLRHCWSQATFLDH
jgi:hypothetical protein